MFVKSPKTLSLIFFLISIFAINSFAQTEPSNNLGTEIKILGGIGGKRISCFATDKLVVTEQEFEKLLKDEKCSPLKSIKVDFEKHTLINYRVGGDCKMRVTHKIFRNDKTKTYTIEVKNYWGRCRAGGSFNSWIFIDKIPADYTVKLKEMKIDKVREKDFTAFGFTSPPLPKPPQVFYNETIDLDGCIPMYRQKQFVIKDKKTYLKNIRNDAQSSQCKANAEKLDFEKFSIIGTQINSGYCRYPKGLQHTLLKDNSKKKYILEIRYIDPGTNTCRALSRYDLWLQVPKLQDNYEVFFDIKPRTIKSKN